MKRKLIWLVVAVLSGVCPVAAEVAPVALPGDVVLAIEGEGLSVSLTEVRDVRCPSEVRCVWEGEIRVILTLHPGSPTAQELVLCNWCTDGERSSLAAGYRFELVRLDPPVAVIEDLGRPAVVTDYTVYVTIFPAR